MSIKSESGRSMIEMIAVIGVVIVLTMGALTGYKQVVASHQAISLHEDILVQAQAQKGHNYRNKSIYDSGIGKKTRMGLRMDAAKAENGDTFSIVVQNVATDTCSYLIKKDWKDAVRLKINNLIYTPQNIECVSIKESGQEKFTFEVIFPKTKASVSAFERTCNQCMSCEECNSTMNICVNACQDSAQFCQDNRCVFSHCPAGHNLDNGNCVACKAGYACSSCAEISNTKLVWDGEKCVCSDDTCGKGKFCSTSGECDWCPENATCPEGVIVCDENYYQSGDTCTLCPENAICENNVISCKNSDDKLLTLTIDETEHYICCPEGQFSTDGITCTNCATGSACATCPTETPYWNGIDCADTSCPAHSSTTTTSEQIGDTACYCDSGYIVNTTGDGCVEISCGTDSYFKEDYGCCMCPANASCDGKNFTCDAGYGQLDYGCIECSQNATCTGGIIQCNTGYYYNRGKCEICLTNGSCDDTNSQCNTGYYRRNNACVACPDGATCPDGVLQCPNGYKEDSFNGGCKPILNCPEGAVDFGTSDKQIPGTQCYCSGNYLVSGTECVAPYIIEKIPSECPTGYHWATEDEVIDTQNFKNDVERVGLFNDNSLSKNNTGLEITFLCLNTVAWTSTGNGGAITSSDSKKCIQGYSTTSTIQNSYFDSNDATQCTLPYARCALCILDSKPQISYTNCPKNTFWDNSGDSGRALENGHCMCDYTIENTCGNDYSCNPTTHRCEAHPYRSESLEPMCEIPRPS